MKSNARFFKSHHISLTGYDFSNPEINANLLEAAKIYQWRNSNGLLGASAFLLSSTVMTFMIVADNIGDEFVLEDSFALPVVSTMMAASLTIWTLSLTKGQKMHKALDRSRQLLLQ